jgi:hypothetical protein
MPTDFLSLINGPVGGAGLVNLGIPLLNAVIGNSANRATAKAEKAIQDANNEISVSRSKLNIVLRGINNKRLLKNIEAQLDAAKTTAARVGEARQRADLETSVRVAETLGAAAAVSALNGVTGAGGVALQTALLLQESRQRTERQIGREAADDDDADRRGQIVDDGFASLDFNRELPSIDNRQIVAAETPLLDVFVKGLVDTREALKGLGSVVGTPAPISQGNLNQSFAPGFSPNIPRRSEAFSNSFSNNFGLGQV